MTTIERMTANTVRQELDGLKYQLSQALKADIKDATADYSDLNDAERAEIYKAILDSMIETLDHHGINRG